MATICQTFPGNSVSWHKTQRLFTKMSGRGLPVIRRSGSDAGEGSSAAPVEGGRGSGARRDRRPTDVQAPGPGSSLGPSRSVGDLEGEFGPWCRRAILGPAVRLHREWAWAAPQQDLPQCAVRVMLTGWLGLVWHLRPLSCVVVLVWEGGGVRGRVSVPVTAGWIPAVWRVLGCWACAPGSIRVPRCVPIRTHGGRG